MTKRRITVSLDSDVADYLDSVPNKSRVVCEAVRGYVADELERELEEAYRADRRESAQLAAEWESADPELDE